jgi:hypothetical protein
LLRCDQLGIKLNFTLGHTQHIEDRPFRNVEHLETSLITLHKVKDPDNPRPISKRPKLALSRRLQRHLIRKQDPSYYPPQRIGLRIKYNSGSSEPVKNVSSHQFTPDSSNKRITEDNANSKYTKYTKSTISDQEYPRTTRLTKARHLAPNRSVVRYHTAQVVNNETAGIEKYYVSERGQSSKAPSSSEITQILGKLRRRYSGRLVRELLPSQGIEHSLRTIADRQLALRIGRAVPQTLAGRRNESIRKLIAGLKDSEDAHSEGNLFLEDSLQNESSLDRLSYRSLSENDSSPKAEPFSHNAQLSGDPTQRPSVNSTDDYQILMHSALSNKSKLSDNNSALTRRQSRPKSTSEIRTKLFVRSITSTTTNFQLYNYSKIQTIDPNELRIHYIVEDERIARGKQKGKLSNKSLSSNEWLKGRTKPDQWKNSIPRPRRVRSRTRRADNRVKTGRRWVDKLRNSTQPPNKVKIRRLWVNKLGKSTQLPNRVKLLRRRRSIVRYLSSDKIEIAERSEAPEILSTGRRRLHRLSQIHLLSSQSPEERMDGLIDIVRQRIAAIRSK